MTHTAVLWVTRLKVDTKKRKRGNYMNSNMIPRQFVNDRCEEFCDRYCRFPRECNSDEELQAECEKCPWTLIDDYEG